LMKNLKKILQKREDRKTKTTTLEEQVRELYNKNPLVYDRLAQL